ncbi:hypothetical protein IW262DRAFT_1062917 [Armillaria fumosa]|nr:hypothetical protein IW262DRAFT_1062917 [Armillaria fumosa]
MNTFGVGKLWSYRAKIGWTWAVFWPLMASVLLGESSVVLSIYSFCLFNPYRAHHHREISTFVIVSLSLRVVDLPFSASTFTSFHRVDEQACGTKTLCISPGQEMTSRRRLLEWI